MPSCLGVYIEDKLIKYAKVSKERDNIKVESFDVRFYENLKQTLNQIIQETNSQKTPIAINVSDEMYDYFEVFSLLNSKEIKRAVEMEFEVLCSEKGYRKELLEPRFLTLPTSTSVDKFKILNVSVNKTTLNERIGNFEKGRLASARPLPTSIMNLVSLNNNSNSIVVNIEDRTYVTVIKNGNINSIEIFPEGMNDILEKINERENSLSKSYEICKNTTISATGTNIEEGNEYIDLIMPTLFSIVNNIKKVINNLGEDVEKIYITGGGSSINNIDLYFQGFLDDIPCEILKPKFLEAGSLRIGIKEYIEVNSAIALALDGLGKGINELNFVSVNKALSISSSIGSSVDFSKIAPNKENFKGKLSPVEKVMLRVIGTACIFMIGYGVISNSVYDNLTEKEKQTTSSKTSVLTAISKVASDQKSVDSLIEQYQEKIDKLKGKTSDPLTGQTTELQKDSLPNFLSQLMFAIPQNVTVESIQNTSGTHISIDVKSKEYQQIGLFKAILYNKKLLNNVTSTGSTKDGDYVKVTVEGDLP